MDYHFNNMSLKEAKLNFVVDIATSLFMRKSISDVTIKDIADKAGIGEATIYRYFKRKENIVLACIMKLQEEVNQKYFKLEEGKTGYEKLEIFYNSYLDVFKNSPDYFYFIREFDAYIAMHNSPKLKEYEREINQYKSNYIAAYEMGLEDGSVMHIKNIEVFYYSTTHSLLELCKKLSIKQALLNQDKSLKKAAEIQCLIRIILKSLKAETQ